jgi:hypothetical protein
MAMATAMVMVTTVMAAVMAKAMVEAMQQQWRQGLQWVDDEKMTVATWEDKLQNLVSFFIGHLKLTNTPYLFEKSDQGV